jgi:shikimate kinase
LVGVIVLRDKNIILIGFMGTGKTTVGKRLAQILQWQHVDTDHVIEEKEGSILEIFHQHGEAYYRQIEAKYVRQVTLGSEQVITTGGGSVLLPENRIALKQSGFVVLLTASPETIIKRVREDQDRPLLQGNLEERVHQLLRDRENAYQFADYTVDTTDLSVDEIVRQIIDQVSVVDAQ